MGTSVEINWAEDRKTFALTVRGDTPEELQFPADKYPVLLSGLNEARGASNGGAVWLSIVTRHLR